MREGGVRSDMVTMVSDGMTCSGDCHTQNDNVWTSDLSHEHRFVSVRSANQRTAAVQQPIREPGDRHYDKMIKYDISINTGQLFFLFCYQNHREL